MSQPPFTPPSPERPSIGERMATSAKNMAPVLVAAMMAGVMAASVANMIKKDEAYAAKPTTAAAAFIINACSIPSARIGFLVGRDTATVLAEKMLQAKPAARGDICVTVYDSISDRSGNKNENHTTALVAVAKSLGVSDGSIATLLASASAKTTPTVETAPAIQPSSPSL